jgi:2-polyprenyl-6-methoxyphenol hydroxylase-like FAD-dependent oxidoreductase
MKGADVVVVGGAVGGTSTALLLAELGASVTLLERVTEPAAVGAGILLQPNGLAVLGGLTLAEELNADGHRMSGGVVRSASGRPISTVAVRDYGPGFGHVLALRRSRLMDVLVGAVMAHPDIDVRFGAEVTSARPDGRVELRSAAGTSSIEADLVVGADGVGSTVRAGGDFGSQVRSTGAVYLRGLVDAAAAGLEGEYWTPLGLFGGAPMGDGSTYFYAAADAAPVAAAVAERDLATFCTLWTDALPLAAPVLGHLTSFDQLLVNEVIRVDCDRWSDGRLVLLGDAAHAMAPTLGQGANSALVDAAVLAIELAAESTDTMPRGLARYEARRKPPVRRVQNQADRLARLSGVGGKTTQWVRDAALRLAGRLPTTAARLSRMAQQENPAELYRLLSLLTATPARDARQQGGASADGPP